MINLKHNGQHTTRAAKAPSTNRDLVAPATGVEAAHRAMRMLVIAYANHQWCIASNVPVRYKHPRTQFITLITLH